MARSPTKKIRRALENNIKGGIVKEQESVRNRVRPPARVCATHRKRDSSLMIFLQMMRCPRRFCLLKAFTSDVSEAEQVQRGVIIFALKDRDVTVKKGKEKTCASTAFPSPKGIIKRPRAARF